MLWGLYSLFIFVFICCHQIPDNVEDMLELSGKNQKELEMVLDYYRSPKDSLKLKAAYFLIANMGSKYAYANDSIGEHKSILNFVDSVNRAMDYPKLEYKDTLESQRLKLERNIIVNMYWDSLNKRYGSLKPSSLTIVRDIDVITSKVLIDNIDLAFKVWKRPWAKHLNFEQFCEYILPYRNLHEPLENWRKEAYTNYSPDLDSLLKKNGTALDAAKVVYGKSAVVKNNFGVFGQYPDLGWKDLNKIKIGTCADQSNFIAYIMRSQGIPVGTVFMPHSTEWSILIGSKGNIFQFGADIYSPDSKFNYYLDDWKSPSTKASKFFLHSYKEDDRLLGNLPISSIPPFFRNPNLKDVTQLLHDMPVSVNTKVDTETENNGYVFLCDYHTSEKWSAVDWSHIENGNVSFPNVGAEKIYLVSLFKENKYTPISYPIYLWKNGVKTILIPNLSDWEKIRLYRKYPRGVGESRFAKKMLGTYFQVANRPDFSDAVTIHKINEVPDIAHEVNIINNKKYRYVRYVADNPINVAELAFSNEEGESIKGQIICSSDNSLYKPQNAFDNDIRTNYNNEEVSSWIGFKFNAPRQITSLKYLFRNSFNTIESEHLYELFYWKDNDWVSLGQKRAKTDYLDYEAPKNSLLLLINLTQGKQSMVFFMKDKKQIWG